MKHPKLKIAALGFGAFLMGAVAQANTPLLTNTNFAGTDPWIAGSNLFVGGNWQEFVSNLSGRYTVESRIVRSGNGVTFLSYDDGVSDSIESYLFQEFMAGPATSPTPTIFSTGDVLVFRGMASATRSGPKTAGMVVRAFIKTLGYNSMGWAFQVKEEYSAFAPIGETEAPFELTITYPDLAVDDSLQVIQIGFEIATQYDSQANAMNSGTITFRNIEAFVEGKGGTTTWLGYPVREDGYADTGSFMGWVWTGQAPWIWNSYLRSWIYVPATEPSEGGEWVYIAR